MKKLILCFLLIASQMFGGIAGAEEFTTDGDFVPEYIAYSDSVSLGESDAEYVPPIVPLVSPAELSAAELPDKYDAREDGRIYYSGLGQSSDNTCWTFSSCLAAETAIKDELGSFTDLSEQHLKYAESSENNNPYGYERVVNSGGNFQIFEAYGAAWRGLVKEEDDPYKYGGEARDYETVTAQKPISFHLRDTINIPNIAKDVSAVTPEQRAAHIAEVKKYILRHGCCFSSMYWDSDYNNYSTKSYFNKDDISTSNHAIAIVGWDDNYSKNNFNETPGNDGAFIIKNSQSATGYYMYMSYEDVYAGWYASCVTGVASKYDYGEIYNYNYFQPGGAYSVSAGTYTTSVNFKSKYDGEKIKAVGAYTVSRNLGYKVYISKSAKGNERTNELYTLAASGTFEMPGLHTVDLDESFELGSAETAYTVRIEYTGDANFEVPVESNVYSGGIQIHNVKTKEGRSYFNTWDTHNNKANLYVKAFTDADYTVTLPFADDDAFSTAKYSINGSDYKSLDRSFAAGLNDDVIVDFSGVTAEIGVFSYSGETYRLKDNKISFKVTESGAVQSLGKASITVRFDANGGSCAPSDIHTKENTEFEIPEEIPSKVGYSFEGWTDGLKIYAPGDKASFSGSTTLTAQWKERAAASLKLGFKAYRNGKETDKLYAGCTYDISVFCSDMTDNTFYGGKFVLSFDPNIACVVDESGYYGENAEDCVFDIASDKLLLDSSSQLDNGGGKLNAVIKIKSDYSDTGAVLEGDSAEIFRFRVFIMSSGDISLNAENSELYFGSTAPSVITAVPFSPKAVFETVSDVNCTKYDNYVSFSGKTDFGKSKTVVCALYSGNKLVGVRPIKCEEDNEVFNANILFTDEPTSAKVLVWDSLEGLSTGFGSIDFDF